MKSRLLNVTFIEEYYKSDEVSQSHSLVIHQVDDSTSALAPDMWLRKIGQWFMVNETIVSLSNQHLVI